MSRIFILSIFFASFFFVESGFAAKAQKGDDVKNDVVLTKSADDSVEVYPAHEVDKNKNAEATNGEKNTEEEPVKKSKAATDEAAESAPKKVKTTPDEQISIPATQNETIAAPEVPIPDPNAKIIEPSPVDKALDRFQQQQQEFEKRARGGY